ncbi:autotransporter outer membrane beta-barrel domain-containing protein, partial [Campylobacter sp. 2018MI35]|nr:autotransporter outer membrane beta-barrel domain-containing protein [Campylobacter sp. 2018MI34]
TEIKTFNNSGIINTNSTFGVNIASGTTIDNFTNTGTIKSTGTIKPSIWVNISTGIYLQGLVKTFTNEGLISGIIGVDLIKGTLGNFINKGTIESTSDSTLAAAINLMTLNGSPSTIDNLTNEGLIKSKSHGILAEAGNYINTIINKGTIEADLNGISFYDHGSAGGSGGTMKLGRIILENGSSIKAGNNGINIDNETSKAIEADGIEVKEGASISGGNSGIYIGGGKEIDTQITISGSVTGGTAGIVNEGVIGSSSS